MQRILWPITGDVMKLGLSIGITGTQRFGPPIREPGTFDALWTITDAELSTLTEFTTVQINGSGAITVIGTTEYSQNGGAFTATAGTIVDGDTLSIRYTSSGTNDTEVIGGVIIDGVNCNASLTTKAAVPGSPAVNPDDSEMLNPDASSTVNPS